MKRIKVFFQGIKIDGFNDVTFEMDSSGWSLNQLIENSLITEVSETDGYDIKDYTMNEAPEVVFDTFLKLIKDELDLRRK